MKGQIISEVMPGITNIMTDIEDREASSYVSAHYDELVRAAKKMGVDNNSCNDIVHDVYMSFIKAENNRCGFNINAGTNEACATVEQFVYGRLKGYSKNKKYHSNIVKDEVYASSSATDDLESLSGAQRAYELAESYDDLEAIENEMSIPEELEYLLSFENDTDVSIRFFLKNISSLANMDFDISLLNGLKTLMSTYEDFSEALRSVMEFAMTNGAKYEVLTASL